MRWWPRSNGAPPAGKWSDIAVLEPVRDYKARHASTLLVFDAVETALAEVDRKGTVRGAAEGLSQNDGAQGGAGAGLCERR